MGFQRFEVLRRLVVTGNLTTYQESLRVDQNPQGLQDSSMETTMGFSTAVHNFPFVECGSSKKRSKYFVMKEEQVSGSRLEDKYMTKSIENRLYLKKKLFRFQYKKEDKALLLLNSLPESYEHLTTTLLYGKDEVKFVDVSNALVNNEYRKKDQIDHRETTPEALTIVGGGNEKIWRIWRAEQIPFKVKRIIIKKKSCKG
ncbi:hypothetical protein FNV43_RR24587 [Rhamnella rubrinervis]|uniref:Uncharacterized protein n=1 Tax=Rhamnella rubrinervis TaxID=2594499 RepID=A0A8K0DTD0_9ROSA|nr:hypothetical protein FNV43_RR24587 [Rhamnella rubrinervis]